jgi:hypothetical protein
MNLDSFEEIHAKGMIADKKVLVKSRVVVLLDLLHCLLHPLLKLDKGAINFKGELLVVYFYNNISNN